MPLSEYVAVKQLLQLQCHNCHVKVTVDPTSQSDVESIQDWLKVQKSNGESMGFCSVDCLQKGAHNLKPSNLVVPGAE